MPCVQTLSPKFLHYLNFFIWRTWPEMFKITRCSFGPMGHFAVEAHLVYLRPRQTHWVYFSKIHSILGDNFMQTGHPSGTRLYAVCKISIVVSVGTTYTQNCVTEYIHEVILFCLYSYVLPQWVPEQLWRHPWHLQRHSVDCACVGWGSSVDAHSVP